MEVGRRKDAGGDGACCSPQGREWWRCDAA